MREKILFNEDWLFHKGDIHYETPADKGPLYMQSKTERMKWGPACRYYTAIENDFLPDHEYNTQTWQTVTLPHDYVIDQEPKQEKNAALGFFNYENAWYRKKFMLTEADKERRLVLFFEGIATQATVYLNGVMLKHNYSGYTSFEVDITDVAEFDVENVLAVYVNTQNHEGWWYEGGGIYRNVWLEKTNRISVERWGLYLAPQRNPNGSWQVQTELTVRNDAYESQSVDAQITISDGTNMVGTTKLQLSADARQNCTQKCSIAVAAPKLWDIDNPFLHTATVKLYQNGECVDEYSDRFGFREYYLDKDEGMFLNGKHIKINGVCAHYGCGLFGKAVPDNIHRYKVQLIREMGANGYRCSHYPHAQSTMDALDEAGMIVMDEVRWFDSSEEGMQQLEMLIRRDRNHPSVFFWSTGNEEMHHITEQGRRINKSLIAKIRSLDNTRTIMAAASYHPDQATIFEDLDAIGINYNLEYFDGVKEKYPDKPIFFSECCATGTTRNWYYPDCPERGYLNAYDKSPIVGFHAREVMARFIDARKWCLGGYQWIAFEHRGEAVWPRLCSQSGAIDLYLQKKDAFYHNQSTWIGKENPMIHLMPHWNFAGREGEIIDVRAYTNCEQAELFVNGKSFGKIDLEKFDIPKWNVPYEKGTITVAGYIGGEKVTVDSRQTTGKAVNLKLRLDTKVLSAKQKDAAIVTCYCVDENGLQVPDAAPFVSFGCNDAGTIVGTGSDVSDHHKLTLPERKMRAGTITVAVRLNGTVEPLLIYADSDGLGSAMLKIELSE